MRGSRRESWERETSGFHMEVRHPEGGPRPVLKPRKFDSKKRGGNVKEEVEDLQPQKRHPN